jgi:putative ABC transport system permease protein
MIIHYVKIAWRNLYKNKTAAAINIGGLAIGIASSILLLSYVSFQWNYDGFNTSGRSIYRVNVDVFENQQLAVHSAENYAAVGPALKKDFPEIADQARLYNMGYKNNCVFSYNHIDFKETKFLYADASFLNMFSYPFLQGDPKSALVEPYTAVVSETVAKKLFGVNGVQDAIGKSIQMTDDDRNSELCKVTGVLKDIPENSHLKFNILISYATLYKRSFDRFEYGWERKDFYTYVLLRPGADPALLEAKLPAFIQKHKAAGTDPRKQIKFSLQPLGKIHLTGGLQDEPEPTVHEKAVSFLMVIAFFIITIAWVNYINLATISAVNRAKEIGIRKVLGSDRGRLIRQFLIESFSLNLIGFLLALMLVYIARPYLYDLLSIHLPLSGLLTDTYGLLFLSFLLVGSFFSGLYPAFFLSSFKPVSILKGRFGASGKGLTLRKSLVVFQFSLSILLIIGTLVVYQQVQFMLHQNLGIKMSQVMVLDRPGRWDTARKTHNLLVQRFKEAILRDPGIESVAMSDEKPGKEIRSPNNYVQKSASLAATIAINTTSIDEGYLPELGFHLLAGRNFSLEFKTDARAVILSESAVKLLGFADGEHALGKELRSDDGDYTVIGVVNDFHQLSLQRQATPSAFQFGGRDLREFEYYLLKLKPTGMDQTVAHIRSVWTSQFKDNPFEYSFLDETFNRQYRTEIQFGVLFGIFSFLAIFIACTGLLALVAFMVRQRTKEIGVRKVLGAKIRDIVILLTKDFIRLIVLANFIAWPLGWWLMNGWLMDFAYRIQIHWPVFLLSGLIALLIALATISFQTVRAALSNPVRSLQTE